MLSMTPRNPSDEDPTGEDDPEILEFDGTKTDQLDETYRMRIVSASENQLLSGTQRVSTLDPAAIDKVAGYDPYETATEIEPPEGFVATDRNLKPPTE